MWTASHDTEMYQTS